MKFSLSDGREIVIDIDTPVKDPRAQAKQELQELNEEMQRRKEEARKMKPTIETCDTGVTAIFPDGAKIFLSIQGRSPCTLCNERLCEHFHAALPHFARWKWETAQRTDCPWGPTLLQSIGIVPPYIVRPDLIGKQSRWAPFSRGEELAPGVRVWRTHRGKLYRFSDNGREGHVYVGDDHPDGHTPCLVCGDGCCGHVEEALAWEARLGGER